MTHQYNDLFYKYDKEIMHTRLENKIHENRFLFITLTTIALINIVSNYFGEYAAIIIGSYIFLSASGTLVILSFMTCYKFGITGKHGIAWVMFASFSVSWYIAEIIWIIYDVYLEIDPFPSIADFLYVSGYLFLFVFMLFYLKPMKYGISHKMFVSAIFASSILLVFGLTAIGLNFSSDPFNTTNEQDVWGFALALSYPVLDSIVLVPAILGLVLFLKGQVNFLWSLICLAIVSVSIADTAFVLGNMDELYHIGHTVDIFFLWTYVLMSFGVYNHYTLFRS
jgi:hypothetical protein